VKKLSRTAKIKCLTQSASITMFQRIEILFLALN